MTQDGMWQDSGRYEWPLTGVPGEQTTAPATKTALQPIERHSLITPWYERAPAGPGASSGDIKLYASEQANGEIAALHHQVEELKAENCDLLIGHAELTRRLNELRARVAELEQGGDGRTL